jgi:hypothetical protein
MGNSRSSPRKKAEKQKDTRFGEVIWASRCAAYRDTRQAGLCKVGRGPILVHDPDTFVDLEKNGGQLHQPGTTNTVCLKNVLPKRVQSEFTQNLTGTTGDTWQRQRTCLTSLVFPAALGHKHPQHIADKCATSMCDEIETLFEHSQSQTAIPLDLKDLLTRHVLDWTVELVMGAAALTAENQFKHKFLAYWCSKRAQAPPSTSASFLTESLTFFRAALNELALTRYHELRTDSQGEPCSLLDGMLKHCQPPPSEEGKAAAAATEDTLTYQEVTVRVGSCGSMTRSLWHLLR